MKNKILSIVITLILFLTAFSSFVFAAPILTSSISATPATVNSGDTITVTMTVTNSASPGSGNNANGVQPSSLTLGGTGSATLASGPDPTSRNINAGQSRTFTWTYTAVSEGTVNFTGNAGDGTVSSTSTTSNDVTIQAGTPGVDCTHSFTVNCDSYENIDFDYISCVSDNNNHYQSHTNPSHGSVSVISNRMIRYTPVSGYSGTDSFTFTAGGKTVQVNVTVTCNSPPIPDCTYYVDYNCATGDIIDVNGTVYDYINVNDAARTCYPTANYKGSIFLVNPNPGTAVFAGQGNQIDYSLSDCNGYCGQTDTLTFLADKSGAGGDIPDPITIKVVIGIICSNGNGDQPIANADSAEVCKEACVTIGVLSNDINKGVSPQINFIGTPTGGTAELSNGKIKYCAPEIPGTYFFDYTFSDGEVTSNTATVTVIVNDCITEKKVKLLPPSILYPGIDIIQLTVPSSGTNVIFGGKVVSPLEVAPGTQSLSVQVKNKGFLTQIDAGVRLEGLPQGVSFSLEPLTQKIKGHNIGTYTMTLTVPPTTPSGTYPIKAVSYSRRGITDRVEFNLIVD